MKNFIKLNVFQLKNSHMVTMALHSLETLQTIACAPVLKYLGQLVICAHLTESETNRGLI